MKEGNVDVVFDIFLSLKSSIFKIKEIIKWKITSLILFNLFYFFFCEKLMEISLVITNYF